MTTQRAPAATVRTLNTIDVFVALPERRGPLDHLGRRRVVGLEDESRAASTRVPPWSPTRRQRMWLFARRGG